MCLITSCTNVKKPSLAVQKNNQAVELAMRYSSDSDSLNKVISLLDEAIAIDPSYELAYDNIIQYLVAQGDMEKALDTILQLEKLGTHEKDPVLFLGKGMLLEANDKSELASKAYKQAASLFEARIKEKPVEIDLMNYFVALYLRDNQKYSLDEFEQKYPNVFQDATKEFRIGVVNTINNNSRKDIIYELLGCRNDDHINH